MTASFVELFIRFGKVQIVSIADSYLLLNTFAKPPRMSKDVIRTNYFSLSPFNDPDITSLSDKNDLLVWFSIKHKNAVRIPESYLLYRALMQREERDRICIFKTDPQTAIVIKEGRLVAQSLITSDVETFIQRLKREHSLSAVEHYSAHEHTLLIKSGYAHLTFGHWQQLLSFEPLDTAKLKSTLENVATPLSVLVLVALGYHYAINYQLTKQLEESRASYKNGKGAMIPIKHRLDMIQKDKKTWDAFIEKTLIRPDALSSALPLLQVAKETNTTVKYIKVSSGKVETVIETSSSTAFLKAIVKQKKYENVKLEFSRTDPLRQIDNAKLIAQVIPYDLNGTRHEH